MAAMEHAELDTADVAPDYHIEAQTSLVERALRTLKHGDAFAVLDAHGDIGVQDDGAEGLFYKDMRHLSQLRLGFCGRRPLLLSSVMQDDNAALLVNLTNPDIAAGSGTAIAHSSIALERMKFLWNDVCHERINVRNFGTERQSFEIGLTFGADFKDLFEVRGVDRLRRGSQTSRVIDATSVELSYEGLDGSYRRTILDFAPRPIALSARHAVFRVDLEAHAHSSIVISVACQINEAAGSLITPCVPLLSAYRQKRNEMRQVTQGIASIETSNSLFNEMLCQSAADLQMLMTQTPFGRYPYAGIPWYSTIFGRDGIITAMLMLWLDPSIAKGVLRTLAGMQATKADTSADAQPGKILHETRQGEMAVLGEVPFHRYYGTVDATPLFVMLAGLYYERTGDRETLTAIWPNVKAALSWIDSWGDRDGDGFVEYFRETPNGLANQGWKDSHDSIVHADGSLAHGPIALVEVQGYVYAAKLKAAALAAALDEQDLSRRLTLEAHKLRVAFDDAFWCEDMATFALALDGAKQPCRVRTSNAGHALISGIALPARATRLATTLLSRDSSSGWGIRTLARGEVRYNPMSYHNGSVWPHDNAVIAMGLSRYGLKSEVLSIFEALYGAHLYATDLRLPELFCGFSRQRRRGPTQYPVACSPQAWAAATPFALLAASLGIEMDHAANTLCFQMPVLPPFLDQVEIRDLKLGASAFDLQLERRRGSGDVAVNIARRAGDARIIIAK